jgi:hypothetical protein
MKTPITAVVLVSAFRSFAADPVLLEFPRQQLTDQFWAEGAAFGDLNHDGVNDIVYGPYWWEGPDFKTRHEFYPATATFDLSLGSMTKVKVPGFEGALGKENTYSDNFFCYTHDFNGDGWDDVLVLGFPGKDASWFENPGKGGADKHWERHIVFDMVDNESPTWTDLTGTGKPQIVCNSGGYFGYVAPDWKNPSAKWTFHQITPKGDWQRFTHGMGVGDVNGDGRMDLLEKDGWWEQPASLAGDPIWKFHAQNFGTGGSQMFAYDVNGDGLNDVITSLAAHGYGLAWYEQYKEDGAIKFKAHVIMNKSPNENPYGVAFSQLHAVDVVDMDGDGVKDIVTGKRFWAHGSHGDADPGADPVLYWFKLVRGPNHSVNFVPHLISKDTGVGTQVTVGDINKDGLPDVLVGNKRGVFVHLQQRKTVSLDEWMKAQPKPVK